MNEIECNFKSTYKMQEHKFLCKLKNGVEYYSDPKRTHHIIDTRECDGEDCILQKILKNQG